MIAYSPELRLGRWQDVLSDVEMVDAVITDPPYSQKTEDGFRSGSVVNDAPGIGYDPIDETYCRNFVSSWSPRCRGWFVVFGDHITNGWWSGALSDAGLYTFPPVVWAKNGAAPRMSCDGPGSHVEYIAVARPRRREFLSWGSLRGWYTAPTVRASHGFIGVTGAKPLCLMRAIVGDYSRIGDLVVDPHAGSGTTLLAAAIEGRRAIGSEMDPETFTKAQKRLSAGFTTDMFAGAA